MAHGKPFTGPQATTSAGRTMQLKGQTDWQEHSSGSDTFLISDLIITLDAGTAWTAADKPEWFVAFPSSADDPTGTRDYIIIKGKYEWVLDSAAPASASGDPTYIYR